MAVRGKHLQAWIISIVAMDIACLLVSAILAVLMRIGYAEMSEYILGEFDGWLILLGSIILGNYLAGAYGIEYLHSSFNVIVGEIFSLVFTVVIVSITSYAWLHQLIGRGVLGLTIGLYTAISLFLRIVVYKALFSSRPFQRRVVIIGTGKQAGMIRQMLENKWILPVHKIIAFVRIIHPGTDSETDDVVSINGIAVLNSTYDSLANLIKSLDIDLVVLAQSDNKDASYCYRQLSRLRFEGIEVLTMLSAAEIYAGRIPLELVTEEDIAEIAMQSRMPSVRRIKRVFDIFIAMLGCIILFPLGMLIAILLKLTAPGSPVFYSQIRAGLFGKSFTIFKFRTMYEDAEKETGVVWAKKNDPRITPLGKILRRFRLDEIPQLYNVLKGEMSIVGPRPERPELVAELDKKIPFYIERLNVMPGLTGWAQIRFPYGDSVEDAMRKLEYDLYYIKHLSLSFDLQIILRTFRIVILGMERTI